MIEEAAMEYLSRIEAAQLLGVDVSTVDHHIGTGWLPVARPGVRGRKSLSRADVEEFRRQRDRELQHQANLRTLRAHLAADRADPPEGTWLSVKQAAQLLGWSPAWVRRLAAADRLPNRRRGHAYRFRKDLIELVRNAHQAAQNR